ncbi:EmrB/QacA subfamily drug resistance transporter [Scopulibacillus daqui]|uniref:EmrB/QacA subfamily drug resistance transporter n=1 Tax=Scopulibacillus daqui TaxID=1469162 RepID=A0ABS2Q0D0_9BACL|nr:DHA2 family efflux MFS transporter permease subunit [Scopulibacillus daqui]MBM7645755.1 EmrB/QacA subfamily drug resistance transporter [Scopulibacillus daqui]
MDTVSKASVQNIKKGPIITVMIMGAFVAILNQTLMNVALPQVMNSFHITATTAQWMTTGYMLVNGVLIPITAYLMERFTTRQLFTAAMGLFAVGTFICGIAPSFFILILGRLVQASGAGIMMPLLTNVILTIFPPEKRGSAMGVVGVAMIFAPAIGPTLSGWIVQTYSWRLLFFVILPIAIIDIIVAAIFLKNVTKVTKPKLDILGVILSTVGFGGILYGFSSAGNKGWTDPFVLNTIFTGVVALDLFVVRELKVSKPMLEFRVFKYGMFTLAAIINIIITMAMFAAMLLLPIYLQNIRGFTPLESGLLLLPGAIIMGIMNPITGYIFDKAGPKWLAVIGLIITAVTTYMFSRLTDSTTYTALIMLYSCRMFGMSMLMMPIMTAGLNALPQSLNAHGTAMVNTLRQVSGSLGTAFLITVMSSQTKKHAQDLIQSLAPHTKKQMAMIAKEASIRGINDAFIVAAALSLLALILAFFLKKTRPPQEEGSRETGKRIYRNGKLAGNRG